jgi:hypothetical protein
MPTNRLRTICSSEITTEYSGNIFASSSARGGEGGRGGGGGSGVGGRRGVGRGQELVWRGGDGGGGGG